MAEKEEAQKHLSFALTSSGTSFFVTVPPVKRDIIKKLGGSWNQSKKAYVFLTSKLTSVEKALGLEPGESGIKDPTRYFPTIFIGEFRNDKGFDAMVKSAGEYGFKWNKQRKHFEGPMENQDKVKEWINL